MNEQRPSIPQPVRPGASPLHPAQHAPSAPAHSVHGPGHAAHVPGARPAAAPSGLPKIGVHPTQPLHVAEGELDSIGLVEELEADPSEKKIKAFGITGAAKAHDWKRKTACTGQGACRMKTFHGKLSDQGMQYLDDAVNEWLDAHPDVEVKFVTSSVGTFEGKIREPALVLNLWY